MNNYLVDASVYALPHSIPDKPDEDVINSFNCYLNNLSNLVEFIGANDRNLKINYFQFSSKDIELLIKKELFWDVDTIKKIRKMAISKNNRKMLDSIGYLILDELCRLRWAGKCSKPEKLCSIEAYIGIDEIEIEEDFICNPDITKEICNIHITDNLKKNICRLAFLNNKIFLDNNITKIITGHPEKECKVNILITKIKHNFNNIEQLNINILNSTVQNHNLKILDKCDFSSIDEALNNAERDFKETVEYNKNIYSSIKKYKEGLSELRSNVNIDILKVDNFKKEYPYMVYRSIDILNKLVKYYGKRGRLNPLRPLSERFHCSTIGVNEICNKCCGFLRICGFDCSDEKDSDIKNEHMIDEKLYRIHLKTYTIMETGKYENLALRIYFRWDSDKIEIGYIGKHL